MVNNLIFIVNLIMFATVVYLGKKRKIDTGGRDVSFGISASIVILLILAYIPVINWKMLYNETYILIHKKIPKFD